MAYRPDIDGLRGLAVIAVVLFHSGVPGLTGGYAGVDIFFVISGYLITRLLESSRDQPARRALAEFYLRRARRILPALLVTCAVSALVALVLFVPRDLVSLGKYLVATPLLLSNVATWLDGGYFVERNQGLPLTHLWSIAVEEQFYLIYPVTLLVLTRFLPRRRGTALLTLLLMSLALCIWASRAHPSGNYLAAPTRGWQLLLGAALALGVPRVRPLLHSSVAVELLALASVLVIAVAVHTYDAQTPYPGIAAIPPCLAAAALIVAGESTRPPLVNRLLAWRPLVAIGLISYSLYLWHRPALVFVRYYHITPLGPMGLVLLLAAITLLSFLSWRYIEQPVRTRSVLRAPRALLSIAVLASAGVLVAGIVIHRSQGFPQRFPLESRRLFPENLGGADWQPCLGETPESVSTGLLCNAGAQTDHSRVLVWGDSHALALMPAYQLLAGARGARLYLAFKAFCPPLLGPSAAHYQPLSGRQTQSAWCANFNSAVLRAISRLDPQTVILDARWIDAELPAGVADIASGIERTARRLADEGRSVCVVLGVPSFAYSPPYALAMAGRRSISSDFLRLSREDAVAQFSGMEPAVRALAAAHAGIAVADPKDALCPTDSCLYAVNGRSLFYDSNHLSPYGAHYVAGALEGCFDGVGPLAGRPAGLRGDATR